MTEYYSQNQNIELAKGIYEYTLQSKSSGGSRKKKGDTNGKYLAFGVGGGADAQLAISYAKANENYVPGVACYTRRAYWGNMLN
jgi:hypothetical protein